MKNSALTVLCITDYFLPGFKGGGPIRTLANMSDMLSGQARFLFFTRDRDLGADTPYPDIVVNDWNERGDHLVYYASPDRFNAAALNMALRGKAFDLMYLNSYFSYRGSISIYLNCIYLTGDRAKILLAPRGEFSPGALAIKRLKKSTFLNIVRTLGLYRRIHWHASTQREADEILDIFPDAAGRIHLAADPVVLSTLPPHKPRDRPSQSLRMCFISRISPMKNLDGLLSMLALVHSPVHLDIYGPMEDTAYWQKCLALMAALPAHVTARYCGELLPDQVSPTFAMYDVFVFPTHGENFGHVIFEALQAGTPVLLSDRTAWRDDPSGALSTLSLDNPVQWQKAIEHFASQSAEEDRIMRHNARNYADRYLASSGSLADNLAMLRAVANIDG